MYAVSQLAEPPPEATIAATDRHYSPSGVFGDPTLATWQKGERITEATIAAILKDIDDLALAALPRR